jgi:hypothetical protein
MQGVSAATSFTRDCPASAFFFMKRRDLRDPATCRQKNEHYYCGEGGWPVFCADLLRVGFPFFLPFTFFFFLVCFQNLGHGWPAPPEACRREVDVAFWLVKIQGIWES